MADFALFFPKLMRNEGGYVDHPSDPGGETFAGVARTYNPQWAGWPLVDAAKKKLGLRAPIPTGNYAAINKELAAQPAMRGLLTSFYKKLYWDALGLDGVKNQVLAEQLADHATSAGTGRPPRMIQFAANQVIAAEKANADQVEPGEIRTPLVVDGQLGPKTYAAINTLDQVKLLRAFVQLRRDFYQYRAGVAVPAPPVLSLLKSLSLRPDPKAKVFLKSWLARLPKV